MVNPDNRCLCLSVWVRTSQFVIKNRVHNVGDNGFIVRFPTKSVIIAHVASNLPKLHNLQFSTLFQQHLVCLFLSCLGVPLVIVTTHLLLHITFIIQGVSTMNTVHSLLITLDVNGILLLCI